MYFRQSKTLVSFTSTAKKVLVVSNELNGNDILYR